MKMHFFWQNLLTFTCIVYSKNNTNCHTSIPLCTIKDKYIIFYLSPVNNWYLVTGMLKITGFHGNIMEINVKVYFKSCYNFHAFYGRNTNEVSN